MSHVRTVEDSSDVTLTATTDLRHRCPHVDETDIGRVTITWRVLGKSYELHSLAKYLDGFRDSILSHEQITDRIRHDLSVVREIELISVNTTWVTAHMEVTCSTSPTLVGRP